jgi:hypothetical protein
VGGVDFALGVGLVLRGGRGLGGLCVTDSSGVRVGLGLGQRVGLGRTRRRGVRSRAVCCRVCSTARRTSSFESRSAAGGVHHPTSS